MELISWVLWGIVYLIGSLFILFAIFILYRWIKVKIILYRVYKTMTNALKRTKKAYKQAIKDCDLGEAGRLKKAIESIKEERKPFHFLKF